MDISYAPSSQVHEKPESSLLGDCSFFNAGLVWPMTFFLNAPHPPFDDLAPDVGDAALRTLAVGEFKILRPADPFLFPCATLRGVGGFMLAKESVGESPVPRLPLFPKRPRLTSKRFNLLFMILSVFCRDEISAFVAIVVLSTTPTAGVVTVKF